MKNIKLNKKQVEEMNLAYERNKTKLKTLDEAFAFKLGYMQAFSLNVVSQQRELLIAFEADRHKSNWDGEYKKRRLADIEQFLAIYSG